MRLDAAGTEDCPAGGTAIVTGLDLDGDGALSDDEATDREVVCSGADGDDGADAEDTDEDVESGSGSLVTVTTATAGECPEGGVAVLVGDDTDGDGTLTGDEVTTRQVVCSGADGADGDDGQDGEAPLVVLEEATEAECPGGGVAVLVGDDDDGDGTLSEDEVTHREPVCGASSGTGGPGGGGGATTVYGLVTIGSTADFARLAGVERIVGALRVSCDFNPLPDLLPLATLEEVTGDVRIERCTQLADLSGLDALTSVGNSLLVLDLPDLRDLTGLGALRDVQVSFALLRLEALVSLAGTGPFTTLGGLSVEEAPLLTSLAGLTPPSHLGGHLRLAGNAALTDLGALGPLTSIAKSVTITQNDRLVSLAGLEQVHTVGFAFYLLDNAALPTLDGLSGLRSIASDVLVEDNPVLRDISGLHGLTSYRSASATWRDNRCLPTSQKTDFETATGLSIGSWWASNGTAAPCP